ncbi:MAG: Peptidase, family, partial [Labilithrix sp.]|nr:Peptidase, family [Labilithrix sp.]
PPCATPAATAAASASAKAADAGAPAAGVTAEERMKELVDAYNARDPKRSFSLMNVEMQAAFPFDKEAAWIDTMLSQGPLLAFKRIGGESPQQGIFELKAEHGLFRAVLTVDAAGKIAGLGVKELKVEPPVAKSTLAAGLPFKGEWLVFWGGPTPGQNHHVGNPSQRRAADLVKVDNEGKDHTGTGKKNTDYLAFGAEILAVADGTVVAVVDGVHDNEPGVMNPYAAFGNMVIVQHEGGAHSVYGHLKNHSPKVKEGAKVKKGAVLGLCGSSGNASQPHLHFQLQDGPTVEASWGIEPVFPELRLTRDGKTSNAKDYTFLKGDRIEAPRG